MKLAIVLSLIVITMIAAAQVQHKYTTTKKSNKWQWTAASGDVQGYVLSVSYDLGGEWQEAEQIGVETTGGIVTYVHTVETSCTYRIKVAAVDSDGNTGPWSEPSEPLSVILRPGKPEFVGDNND